MWSDVVPELCRPLGDGLAIRSSPRLSAPDQHLAVFIGGTLGLDEFALQVFELLVVRSNWRFNAAYETRPRR